MKKKSSTKSPKRTARSNEILVNGKPATEIIGNLLRAAKKWGVKPYSEQTIDEHGLEMLSDFVTALNFEMRAEITDLGD